MCMSGLELDCQGYVPDPTMFVTQCCYHRSGMIASQKAFGLGYKTVYDDQVAVRAVLQDFAKRFSLPADVCTLWQLQNKLSGSTVLSQVWL